MNLKFLKSIFFWVEFKSYVLLYNICFAFINLVDELPMLSYCLYKSTKISGEYENLILDANLKTKS